MGSRKFFYFFPSPGKRFALCKAVQLLDSNGFRFQAPVFVNTIGAHGELISSVETSVRSDAVANICELLAAGYSLDVTCGDPRLNLGCSFGSPSISPIFSISTSRKGWLRLADDSRASYEHVLARVASEMRAHIVLVIDDPADDILGSFACVGEEWLVDLQLEDGSEYDPCSVWVDMELGPVPVMRGLQPTGRRIETFDEYVEHPP